MNVLITGTSSGFGKLTTKTLAKKGHTVFATMRGANGKNASAAAELRAWGEGEGKAVHVVELDVTSQASVDAAVSHILSKFGHIDVAVNNAGYAMMGYSEAFSAEQMQALFDVNVFGVQRVNRAVLPSMRARSEGLLIQISSGLGRFVLPCMGIYSASKFALEGLTEAYRYELAMTGVDAVLIQPGAFPTDIGGKVPEPADNERSVAYGQRLSQHIMGSISSMLSGPNPPDPQMVADAVTKLIETPAGQRPLRTVVDAFTGEGIEAVNAAAAAVQSQSFQAMGLDALVTLKAAG